MTLAYIEEDDSRRVLFRVRPLLAEAGPISPESLDTFEQEGYLRVAPDRQELHTFKERMAQLGSLCVIDLRDAQTALFKVRPNKNYSPMRGERNRYIVYSDAIQPLPAGLVYEVVPEERSGQALTRQYYLRTGGRITGPHCPEDSLSCPSSQVLMPDCERLFLVDMPDGSSHMFYWPEQAIVAAPEEGQEPQVEPANIATEAEAQPYILFDEPEAPETPDQPVVVDTSEFMRDAYRLRTGLTQAGFVLNQTQANHLLLACLLSPRLLLQGDCEADAHLAASSLAAVFPDGEAVASNQDLQDQPVALQLLHAASLLPARGMKRYLRTPWPVFRLTSGRGYPSLQSDAIPKISSNALQPLQEHITSLSEEDELNLLFLFTSAHKAGCAYPISLRAQMARFLCCCIAIMPTQAEAAMDCIRASFALPWLLSQGLEEEEAAALLRP